MHPFFPKFTLNVLVLVLRLPYQVFWHYLSKPLASLPQVKHILPIQNKQKDILAKINLFRQGNFI